MTEKRNPWRPTKYKPEMCDKVIELMSEGASKAEVCLELGICFDTFQAYKEKYKDFSEAVKKGQENSQGWWESQGRKHLENKDFSATLWFMNMKNRFRESWRDKQEIDHNHTITHEQALDDLE